VADRYRANEPRVIHQTIEGETVIIHLERGLYYSLDETGAQIWQGLAAGQSATEISDWLAARFPSQGAEVGDAVLSLVDRLRAEELIVAADGPDRVGAGLDGHGVPDADPMETAAGAMFRPPRLERFDDLQDLLLLDPIHAVDESGWPERLESS
jgi:hypothetical protein